LLRLPVCFNGIEGACAAFSTCCSVGRRPRAVGLEVVCRVDERRFLPLAVTTVDADLIATGSALLLLDESGLSFYCEEARTPRALRGARTDQRGVEGVLRDIVLGEDGRSRRLCLLRATERRECRSTA